MSDREREIRADVLVFRSISKLDAEVREVAMLRMGMNMALIAEKNQASILVQLYEGVEELASRLGGWEKALKLTRATVSHGADNKDEQAAYNRMLYQTNHLFGL